LSAPLPNTLAADVVKTAAHAVGFPLVGLARAEPLDPAPLEDWLARGYAGGLASMYRRIHERLDPGAVVPAARTVVVLGIPYGAGAPPFGHTASGSIARYARGRDYHYAHRDRMRLLRGRLRKLAPSLRSYACVDSGAAMEKAWAERAGLGFVGKNGVVINRRFGSWLTLSLMVLDHAVDSYDEPHPRLCGSCDKCLAACPTAAFPSPGVVDARRCLSYHTVESREQIPEDIAASLGSRVFGCDACQEVCPWNTGDLPPGDPRQAPRPVGLLDASALAALSEARFSELASGTPLRRIGFDGLRRSACLSLGATRDHRARPLLNRLAQTDPSCLVRDAASWALLQLGAR
jgi:epoxyqueuosine reductase